MSKISLTATMFWSCISWAHAPEVRLEDVLNAATVSGNPDVGLNYSRGTILMIRGKNLAPAEQAAPPGFPLPVMLQGTEVRFTDIPGPLLYVSPTQINTIVPNVMEGQTYGITVITPKGSILTSVAFSPQRASPGIFTADGSGCGRPTIWSHPRNRFLEPAESVEPGEAITLYGTGFGPPIPPDREAAPAEPRLTAELPFQIRFARESEPGLLNAEVLWQGKTPGAAGLDQFDVQVPEDAQPGCAVPLRAFYREPFPNLYRSQILHLPVAKGGGPCRDLPRPGYLRLILVREINSAVPGLPERRDRLWVDFFRSPPPPLPRRFTALAFGNCNSSRTGRFLGRVCPGLDGVTEDFMADTTPFDSDHWPEKVPQDAGIITVTAGAITRQLQSGLPNGLPFYPTELEPGTLQAGEVVVAGSGGEHIGPFEARITLPPFEITTQFAPGSILGSLRGFARDVIWRGGPPEGIARWGFTSALCKGRVSTQGLSPGIPLRAIGDVEGDGKTFELMISPGESEEVTINADGLAYGGRLTYLYVYRYGGLRVVP